MIKQDKENMLAVAGIALFSLLLLLLMSAFPIHAQTPAEDFYSQFSKVSTYAATDHEVWVWCNMCHRHLPEINGVLSDWDYIDSSISGVHPHQQGFSYEEIPIGDVEPLVIFAVIAWLVIGIVNMFNNLYKKDDGSFCSSKT